MVRPLTRASLLALIGLAAFAACTETTNVVPIRMSGAQRTRADSLRAAGVRISAMRDVAPDPGMVSCGGSTVDCPDGVTATPGYFIGSDQPDLISVTLGAGSHHVTVTGSGAIDCSGNYGDLVGYDASGAEVGRSALQLIDPADCSPPDWPDNITYGATASLSSSATIVRIEVTPMSPTDWTLDWFGQTLYARASQFYTVAFDRAAPATLDLQCTPASVKRAESVKCSASATDGSTPTVTKWQFVSNDPLLPGVKVDGPPGLTWEGQMIVSGVVTVTGKVGGGAEQTKDASIQVNARDWSSDTVEYKITVVPTPYDDPPKDVHELGSNDQGFSVRIDNYASPSSGPNEGIGYYTAIPFRLTFDVNYNDKAMQTGSVFYKMQPLNATTYNGIHYCARSRVVSDIPKVKQHEGFSADDHNSHTDVYKRFFLQETRVTAEKIVAATIADLNPQPVGSAAHSVAIAQSHQITDLSSANPYSTDCEFNYDPKVRIP